MMDHCSIHCGVVGILGALTAGDAAVQEAKFEPLMCEKRTATCPLSHAQCAQATLWRFGGYSYGGSQVRV